jgi:O-antigen/teichoic acid export membrane protein
LPRLQPGYRLGPAASPSDTRRIISFSSANYVSVGLWTLPTWLLPLIVLNLLGQEANGFFFISWAIASLLFSIPTRTSQSLFSEGSNREQLLARDTKRSFWLVITLLTPGVAFVLLLADKLLLIFGREYSAEGTQLLRLVAISAIPVAINSIYLAGCGKMGSLMEHQ